MKCLDCVYYNGNENDGPFGSCLFHPVSGEPYPCEREEYESEEESFEVNKEARSHLRSALDALYTAILELDMAEAFVEDDYDTSEKIQELYEEVLDMTTDIEETFGISTEDE